MRTSLTPSRIAVITTCLIVVVLPAVASAQSNYASYAVPVFQCLGTPSTPAGTETAVIEYINKGGGDIHLEQIPVVAAVPEAAGLTFTGTIGGQPYATVTFDSLGTIPALDLSTKHGNVLPALTGATPVVNINVDNFGGFTVGSSTCGPTA